MVMLLFGWQRKPAEPWGLIELLSPSLPPERLDLLDWRIRGLMVCLDTNGYYSERREHRRQCKREQEPAPKWPWIRPQGIHVGRGSQPLRNIPKHLPGIYVCTN